MITTSILCNKRGLEKRVDKLGKALSLELAAHQYYGPAVDMPYFMYSARKHLIKKTNRKIVSTIDYFGRLKDRIEQTKNPLKKAGLEAGFDEQAKKFVNMIEASRYMIMPLDVVGQTTIGLTSYPDSIKPNTSPYVLNIAKDVHANNQHGLLQLSIAGMLVFSGTLFESLRLTPPNEVVKAGLLSIISGALSTGLMIFTILKFPGHDGVGKRTKKTQENLKAICESAKNEQHLSTVN